MAELTGESVTGLPGKFIKEKKEKKMFVVKLDHKLVIKARKAVDEILDTTGEITRTIKLTGKQAERIGTIDELAFRIRAELAKLSESEKEGEVE